MSEIEKIKMDIGLQWSIDRLNSIILDGNTFKLSPIHDKEMIVAKLDTLTPIQLCKIVDLINSFQKG